MSLRIVPAYSSNKASDLFGSGFEDLGNDFFDQFLTFSPTDNEGPDFRELSNSTVQERSTYDSESAGTSSASQEDIPGDCTAENKTLSLIQNTASTHPTTPSRNHHFYQESSGRAAISDSQLLSLEGITLQSPQIPDSLNNCLPASPTPVRRRHRLVENISKSLKKVTDKPTRNPIRKQTASPTMMCSSRYSQNDFDVWGQKLTLDPSKFNFDFSQQSSDPLSPPPSVRVSSASDKMMMSGSGNPHNDAFSYNQSFPQQYPTTRPADYHTPLATPTLEAHQSRRPSFQLTSPDTMHFPQTPQFTSSTNWTQEPPVAEYNPYGNQNSFSSDADAPPVWWSHASTVPMAQPSPTTFHNNPQRATKSLAVQLQNELAYNANELAMSHSGLATGLMIQMPEPDHSQQSFVVSSPSLPQPPSYFGAAPPQSQLPPFHTPTHARHSSYGAHTPRQQQQQGGQYFTSPTAGHSRIRGRSASSSDSPSPKSSASPSFHVRKRRTPSRKHEPRTPSLGGAVDFVNFTPHDSKKILTGVAPSGSSKTKARREKEALEKRRRLSQAAVRAVRAAGGSVESLVEEGLFV